jgi:hypothetical protein
MAHQVPTGTGALPPARQRRSQGTRETPLAAVLVGMDRGAHRPAERGAPLELIEPRGQRPGEADGHARRLVATSIQPGAAARAQHLALSTAAGAGGWEEQVEESAHQAMLTGPTHRLLIIGTHG